MSTLPLDERREAIRRLARARDRARIRSVLLPVDVDLEQAVLNNDLEAARAALDAGACADVTEEEHFYRAVFWAVHNNNSQMVKLLIENQAEVNAEDQDGNPLLCEAVSNEAGGNPEIVQMLLDAGASAQTRDASGLPPHFWAAMRGNVTVLEMLRMAGASLNEIDHEGMDALMHAAQQGAEQACAYLIQNGADPTRKDMSGWTASTWALAEEYQELSEWLEQQM
jgi:uncharacterized protein